METMWFVWLPFLFFFAVVFGLFRRRRNCPECGAPLSPLQNPLTKTRRQWLVGGYICSKCGCEVDLKGLPVTKGSPTRFPAETALLCLLLIVAGGALNWVLLTRPVLVASAPRRATQEVRPGNPNAGFVVPVLREDGPAVAHD